MIGSKACAGGRSFDPKDSSRAGGGRPRELDRVLPVTIDRIDLSIVVRPFGGYSPISHAIIVLEGFRFYFLGQVDPARSTCPIEGCGGRARASSGHATAFSPRSSLLVRSKRILLCPAYLP